jgi:hypothetical protein
MNKFRFTIHALAIAIFMLAFASMAQAQATRTWVSGVGDDANPCSRTAPCKTFAGAISKTFTAGEIDCLDPGGFGTINITKSITIDGGSAFGSILASGTFGAQVNVAAGNANDPQRRVTLRRLSINGTGASGTIGTSTGTRGVNYISGSVLNVENCYIQNFTQEGINFSHTATGGLLLVKDTNITNCANGMNVTTTAGFVVASLERVRLEKHSSNGLVIGVHGHAHVRDSVISFNNTDGISMAAGVTDGTVNVESSLIASNLSAGIRNGGTGSIVDISNASLMQNGSAFATSSGAAGGGINSHGNNSVNGTIGTTPNPIGQN